MCIDIDWVVLIVFIVTMFGDILSLLPCPVFLCRTFFPFAKKKKVWDFKWLLVTILMSSAFLFLFFLFFLFSCFGFECIGWCVIYLSFFVL